MGRGARPAISTAGSAGIVKKMMKFTNVTAITMTPAHITRRMT
jgi:hypothetical protein